MFKKSCFFICTAAILALTLFPSPAICGQEDPKAAEIIETMRERYEQSIEDIDDYVMVTDRYEILYKKAWDNGRPYFKSRFAEAPEGLESASTVSDSDFFSEQLYSSLKSDATYEGTEEIEDHTVHLLYVEKVEGLFEDSGDMGDTAEDVWLYVDSEKFVLRKMKLTLEALTPEGEKQKVEPVIHYRDYRNVGGMMVPYETTAVVTGLAMSEEDRKEAEKGLKEMEEKLEEMPPDQREMVEQMMGGQIEEYRKMLEDDKMKVVSTVKEVKVNTGIEF